MWLGLIGEVDDDGLGFCCPEEVGADGTSLSAKMHEPADEDTTLLGLAGFLLPATAEASSPMSLTVCASASKAWALFHEVSSSASNARWCILVASWQSGTSILSHEIRLCWDMLPYYERTLLQGPRCDLGLNIGFGKAAIGSVFAG